MAHQTQSAPQLPAQPLTSAAILVSAILGTLQLAVEPGGAFDVKPAFAGEAVSGRASATPRGYGQRNRLHGIQAARRRYGYIGTGDVQHDLIEIRVGERRIDIEGRTEVGFEIRPRSH